MPPSTKPLCIFRKSASDIFSFFSAFRWRKQQKFSRTPFAIFGLLAENFFFFNCFSMAKSSKSHPTDSDVGVRKAESGVGRLRGFASKPSPSLSLSALRPLFRHRNQVGTRHAGKEEVMDIEVRCQIKYCRRWRHNQSALSFDAEKEGASCGASATGWRIGLILRAPCSAAAHALPRRTTCGGFWYFWPQKYKKKKVCED